MSEKLLDYLPGEVVCRRGTRYTLELPVRSIGPFHRHFGNFAHKVRCYAYLAALGDEGTRLMSGVATLAARYLYHQLKGVFPILPVNTEGVPRMHEFILTLSKAMFDNAMGMGIARFQVIPRVGKLFLDFGLHAPTVAFSRGLGIDGGTY